MGDTYKKGVKSMVAQATTKISTMIGSRDNVNVSD